MDIFGWKITRDAQQTVPYLTQPQLETLFRAMGLTLETGLNKCQSTIEELVTRTGTLLQSAGEKKSTAQSVYNQAVETATQARDIEFAAATEMETEAKEANQFAGQLKEIVKIFTPSGQ